MATHSSILAWRISWTEEPGGHQSTGSLHIMFLYKVSVEKGLFQEMLKTTDMK